MSTEPTSTVSVESKAAHVERLEALQKKAHRFHGLPKIQVTIDRARWDRGSLEAGLNRELQNEQGGRCCLGFVCMALGVPEQTITGIGYPEELPEGVVELVEERLLDCPLAGMWARHPVVTACVIANDADRDPLFQEEMIRSYLAVVGIEVTFVGEGKWSPADQKEGT